jgi:hypothetical protein
LDGTEGQSYSVVSGTTALPYVFDVAYDAVNTKYYMAGLTTVSGGPTLGLRIFSTNLYGEWTANFISDFDCGIVGTVQETVFGNYNQGRIMLTLDNDTPPNMYIKVLGNLYKFSTSDPVSYTLGTIPNVTVGWMSSLNWVAYSGQDYITYLYHDANGDYLKRINDDTLVADASKVGFTFSPVFTTTWTAGTNYKLFFNQWDFDTCYFVDGSNSLKEFNVDLVMAAFIAVNTSDAIMAAGTGDQAIITAEVVNAYGDALSGKEVSFTTGGTGGGSILDSTVTTSGGGVATTTFQVGNNVGVTTITATVTES